HEGVRGGHAHDAELAQHDRAGQPEDAPGLAPDPPEAADSPASLPAARPRPGRAGRGAVGGFPHRRWMPILHRAVFLLPRPDPTRGARSPGGSTRPARAAPLGPAVPTALRIDRRMTE